MKILAAARHPGPAESIAPVVRHLRELGHAVTLIGMRNDTPETLVHGGSATKFRQMGLDHIEMTELGSVENVVSIEDAYADRLFERFDPDRVLVGCSVDATGKRVAIEDALVAGAARHGVPSIQLVEAWEAWYARETGVIAGRYAVLDRITRDVMGKRGADLDRIVVTGNPNMDRFTNATPDQRETVRKSLGVTDERLMMYFGQAVARRDTPNDPKTLGWVVNAMGADDRLVFSPHPRDEREYASILANAGNRLIQTNLTSDEVLHGADVSISHYSTMLMKSSLLDIPSISIIHGDDIYDLRREAGGSPMTILGGVYEVNTSEQLTEQLAGPLDGLSVVLKRSLSVDGAAAQRVADLVLS
ncbi:MAG: CDP-glycerol glycerophosphotransferase family protein [SAR202 cluster bacterium]|jgi:hypothetical protein|nr:CDP-glycerol glycerophosphotransferase family protein [SAR202 cluster bacterium]MDP6513648.1 CDP-glycerol glycerophosphotransferase family protein [SAR202 cluster bacterium]